MSSAAQREWQQAEADVEQVPSANQEAGAPHLSPSVGPGSGILPARIIGIGTSNPPNRYTQAEVLQLLDTQDKRIQALFLNSHIRSRHLTLPRPRGGVIGPETQEELIAKHKHQGLEMAREAIVRCLTPLGLVPRDIDFLCCITSTGFLCPGFSAYLIRDLGFRENTHRVDVLGMGCNAGMNGLHPAAAFASLSPGRLALMVCIEVCSAAYVADQRLETAIVNSLFGDGTVAVLLEASSDRRSGEIGGPSLLGFESHIIPEAIHTMRFDLQDGRLAFFLDRDIPYVIGENVGRPVSRLLRRFGLKKRQISHWIVHSGGRKVIDSIKYNIGLTDYDVRHTLRVLRDYGNLSSGSFLFSLKGLIDERVAQNDDYVVFMAMGPGASIETGLAQF